MSQFKDWDVLGVGEADVDIFLKVPHVPGRDEKVAGELLGEYPGGIVANFCCAASVLGSRTAISTVVAADRYGEMAIADLEAHQVDTSLVRVRDAGSTYFCVVHLDGSGEKALTVVETDCMFPDKTEIDPETFSRSRSVYLMAGNPELATWAAREAKARGTFVSLDLETSDAEYGFSTLRELLANTDLVFPNDTALSMLTSQDDLEKGARQLLQLGAQAVVVKMGSEGCLIVAEDGTQRIPSLPAELVADTTGAGDCFNAAFVTGYLKEWELARCGEFATAAAALSIGKIGARSALPTSDQVEELLANSHG